MKSRNKHVSSALFATKGRETETVSLSVTFKSYLHQAKVSNEAADKELQLDKLSKSSLSQWTQNGTSSRQESILAEQ